MTLTHGAAGIAQVTDACVRDAGVSALRRRVVHTATASVPMEAANVRVLLRNGRQLEGRVQHCRGSTGRPLTDADITEKTLGQLRTAYPDASAERILSQAWRIEECLRVDSFARELAPASCIHPS
jgi:2-methylcitrate dehydratase PrpD